MADVARYETVGRVRSELRALRYMVLWRGWNDQPTLLRMTW